MCSSKEITICSPFKMDCGWKFVIVDFQISFIAEWFKHSDKTVISLNRGRLTAQLTKNWRREVNSALEKYFHMLRKGTETNLFSRPLTLKRWSVVSFENQVRHGMLGENCVSDLEVKGMTLSANITPISKNVPNTNEYCWSFILESTSTRCKSNL